MSRVTARFCAACGAPIARRVPAGDHRERDVCLNCGAVHYVNPRPIVGTIPVWEDSVLLCRRAIEPRYGKWTLPAGFMEVGETTRQGALRETIEETKARVEVGPLFTMIDVPYIEQLHVFFRAELLDLDYGPNEESLEVRLFREPEIPWPELAFRTVAQTLRLFFADRARGQFGTHVHALEPPPLTPPG